MTAPWTRALEQIAYVMAEAHACRQSGFTIDALNYPRSERGLIALCAFNGIAPEMALRGWHYWPNKGTTLAWERVVAALDPSQ